MGINSFLRSIGQFKIISILAIGILVLGVTFSYVTADKDKLGIGANVTANLNVGKSEKGENMSGNVNMSAQSTANETSSNNGASFNGESHENYAATQEESHGYKTKYEKHLASSDDSFTIQSEKHLYKPGEEVKLEGTIWSGLISTVGGINTVSIQVADNNDTTVYSGQNQVDSNGEYSADFTLPSDAKQGAYTISAKADVNANVLSTLTLQTQASLTSSAKFVVVSQNAFAVKAEDKDFEVDVATNSTVSDLKFDEQAKKVSFTVSGDSGTKGVSDVTIPKSLLNGNFTVMIDGQVMSPDDIVVTSDTQDQTTLELNYHHSTHEIDIVGTNAVPEFPVSALAMTLAMTSAIIAATFGARFFKRT